MTKATAATLSNLVEFDCAFRIHEGGYIENVFEIFAPTVVNEEMEAGASGDVWEFINGFSGQDRYSGPIMHSSEYLGGGMAQYVLDHPGVYVITGAYWSPADDAQDDEPDELEGWALLRKKE